MMIRYLILLFFLLGGNNNSFSKGNKKISVEFDLHDFSINKKDGIVSIGSSKYTCRYEGDTKEPALPYIVINYLIGKNEVFESFTWFGNEQKILDNVTITNNPEIIPTNMQAFPSVDSNYSYTGETFPNELIHYNGTFDADGYKYITFFIYPFRYDNINKALYYENNISILLNTNDNPTQMSRGVYNNRISPDRIRNFVINGDDISRLYPSGEDSQSPSVRDGTQVDYIIITADSLKPSFLTLADWKTKKGVRTKVLTTEEIYSDNRFSDSTKQKKIKNALKYYYDNNSLKYALLGGDIHIVPAQMCQIEYRPQNSNNHYIDSCPVDLFYSDLNTMDWDSNRNGIYGELCELSCPYPQIAITRTPVRNNLEAGIFVNRIIEYESNPKIDEWSNNILMCGNMLDSCYYYDGIYMSDAHHMGEELYDEYIAGQWHGQKVRFYDTGTDFTGGPMGANYDFNPTNIQNELAKGYTFVHVITHGLEKKWITEGTDYTTYHASHLNNSNHSIILTTACLTNAFDDYSACLSEAFIRNPNSGVVSYLGCSRDGWHSKSQYGLGTSCEINGDFFETMFYYGVNNFGEIVRQTKVTNMYLCQSVNKTYRWIVFGLNPIGDPEMPIYIDVPHKFANVSISFANGTLIVNTGLDGCKVSVVSANDMGDSYFDVKNNVSSATFTNLTGEYSICITKKGYVPYLAKCGNTVYIQNEFINRDYEVYSNQTFAGSDVTTAVPNGPVEINKGKTVIKGTEVTINKNFKVNSGASLTILSGSN